MSEALKAVSILTAIPREVAADLLSAMPPAAAAEVVRLSKALNEVSPLDRHGWLTQCLGDFLKRHPEDAVRQLTEWLTGAAPGDPRAKGGCIPGGEGFDALRERNDAFLESLVARTDLRMLALALRGASDDLREAVIRNTTLRRARDLHQHLGLFAAATPEQILRAQATILEALPHA